MSGHGEKKIRKQEQAIVALLEESTVTAAADRVGVSEATLLRWQQDADFQSAYSTARSDLLVQTVSHLRRAGSIGVDALIRNTQCGTPSIEVKAGSELLSWLFKAIEVEDFDRRLETLEKASYDR